MLDMNSNLGSIGQIAAPRIATEVESQLTELHALNEHLTERCHSLKARLGSVLRQQDKKESPPTPREALVPLAETLRGIGDMTRRGIVMLQEIEDSVELPAIN